MERCKCQLRSRAEKLALKKGLGPLPACEYETDCNGECPYVVGQETFVNEVDPVEKFQDLQLNGVEGRCVIEKFYNKLQKSLQIIRASKNTSGQNH